MEPEQWLAMQASAREMVQAWEPIFDLLGQMRQQFIDRSNFGERAADQATVAWFKAILLPGLAPTGDEDES